jgi:hypothetical protein
MAAVAPATTEHKNEWAPERVSMMQSREKSLAPAGNQKTLARSSKLYNTVTISTKLIRFLIYMQKFVISCYTTNDIIKALNLHAIKEVTKPNSWMRRHIIRFLN